jgi:predicted N-acyltransferase
MMTLKVDVLDSITKVKREYLDDHFKDPVFSYDWLFSIEHSLPIKILPRHIVVSDKHQIVAVLPCFLQSGELYSTIEDRILGRLRPWVHRIGFKLFPALISYAPLMYKSELIIDGALNKKEIAAKVLTAIEQISIKEKVKVYGFSYVSRDQSYLTDLLKKNSYISSLVVPNTYIEIGFKSFKEYIDYLKKNHRHMANNVKREINKTKKLGIRIERHTSYGALSEKFAHLFGETYFRHTGKKSPLTVDFFNHLASHCRNVLSAYCAFKDDELRAFSLILEGNDIWHYFLSGQDYDLDNKDPSYFYVVFYEPIKEAIERNAKRFYFGPANYETKLRRGCRAEPLYMWLKSPKMSIHSFLSGWLKVTEMRYKRKYEDIILRQ